MRSDRNTQLQLTRIQLSAETMLMENALAEHHKGLAAEITLAKRRGPCSERNLNMLGGSDLWDQDVYNL